MLHDRRCRLACSAPDSAVRHDLARCGHKRERGNSADEGIYTQDEGRSWRQAPPRLPSSMRLRFLLETQSALGLLELLRGDFAPGKPPLKNL